MKIFFASVSMILVGLISIGLSNISQPQDIRFETAPTPTPTPTVSKSPCDGNMPKKTNDNTSTQDSGKPISVQASSAGVSPRVTDLKPTPLDPQAPREINPQNSIPVKTIEPCPTTTNSNVLSVPPRKKKPSSRNTRKRPK